MISVDQILEVMHDKSNTQKYLVVFYTGDAKRGESVVVNNGEKQVETPAMTFDVIGPVTDPEKDTLRVMNTCEEYGKIAVIRTIQGIQDGFNVFPTFAAWYAERPKHPRR